MVVAPSATRKGHPQSAPSRRVHLADVRIAVALGIGVTTAVVFGISAAWGAGLLVGWDAAAVVLLSWTWLEVWPMDYRQTTTHAAREDPTSSVRDVVVLAAAVASLVGVAFSVVAAGNAQGLTKGLLVTLGVVTIALSWAVVHTSFTLRYARLYYTGSRGGIDFNEDEPPQYRDFAYVAFTIGTTFQVSDTNLQSKMIRTTVLRHALLSYLFGVGIIAIMINTVAGLSQ